MSFDEAGAGGVSELDVDGRAGSGREAAGDGGAESGGRVAVTWIDHGSLAAEDAKLVILARSARLRAYVPWGGTATAEGAAVRDTDGRTYAAATVENAEERLTVSALAAAVVAAASSGARRFEAAAIVSERVSGPEPEPGALNVSGPSTSGLGAPDVPRADDLLVLGEFGAGVPVFLAGSDGVARGRVTT
ncbi:hypothetical protein [Candidatus Protofrankia californiensis]|uniref:hypothetical protein n=1 Tax=Candidatus Protofrankia californiensis TaxID=1839754 RepID=UPI0010415E82|nr:hypothetical protein [Candidatus Protofrankia californiensis]